MKIVNFFISRRLLILIAAFTFSETVVSEEIDFAKNCVWTSHDSHKVLSKDFVQKRFIKGLSRPVVSEGQFKLFQNDRIEWHTKTPFESNIVVSKNGISITDETQGSNSAGKAEKLDNAYFRELGAILVTLHSTKRDNESYSKLQQQFSLDCKEYSSGEKLMIAEPAGFQIRKVIEKIEIRGRQEPQTIIVTDSRGDITEVELR